ncbi:hypothetical protein [Mollivirus kamchatka]|nr:hypothetical protein [Mollivirus kamchatka]
MSYPHPQQQQQPQYYQGYGYPAQQSQPPVQQELTAEQWALYSEQYAQQQLYLQQQQQQHLYAQQMRAYYAAQQQAAVVGVNVDNEDAPQDLGENEEVVEIDGQKFIVPKSPLSEEEEQEIKAKALAIKAEDTHLAHFIATAISLMLELAVTYGDDDRVVQQLRIMLKYVDSKKLQGIMCGGYHTRMKDHYNALEKRDTSAFITNESGIDFLDNIEFGSKYAELMEQYPDEAERERTLAPIWTAIDNLNMRARLFVISRDSPFVASFINNGDLLSKVTQSLSDANDGANDGQTPRMALPAVINVGFEAVYKGMEAGNSMGDILKQLANPDSLDIITNAAKDINGLEGGSSKIANIAESVKLAANIYSTQEKKKKASGTRYSAIINGSTAMSREEDDKDERQRVMAFMKDLTEGKVAGLGDLDDPAMQAMLGGKDKADGMMGMLNMAASMLNQNGAQHQKQEGEEEEEEEEKGESSSASGQ